MILHRCPQCGRNTTFNDDLSESGLLCSFCYKALREQIKKEEKEKLRLRVSGKKCSICGKLCIPVRYETICKECYLKGLNPNIKKIEEVK